MSVFVVSDKHISALVLEALSNDGFVHYYHNGECRDQTSQETGHILLNENMKAYNHRYGRNDGIHTFVFDESAFYSPIQILKAFNCYEYQTSESPNWENSEAKSIIDWFHSDVIRQLPGYEEAAWEIV